MAKSIVDEILKRKAPSTIQKDKTTDLNDKALDRGSHAEEVFLDSQPTIQNRQLARGVPLSVVHVDNFPPASSGSFPPVAATPGTTAPAETLSVGGVDPVSGNLELRAVDPDGAAWTKLVDDAIHVNPVGEVTQLAPQTAIQVGGVTGGSDLQAIQIGASGGVVTEIVGGPPVALFKTPQIPAAPAQVTVSNASGALLAANSARTGLVIINNSANVVSIAFGANAAVVNSGITLQPAGGTFVMDSFTFTTQAVNAISAGAASVVGIQEFS